MKQFLSVYSRPPSDIDSRTTITIGDRNFDVDAADLEAICTLGRGAYGIVEKMRHKETNTIIAVKVCSSHFQFMGNIFIADKIKACTACLAISTCKLPLPRHNTANAY